MEKETLEEAAKQYAKQHALSTRHISHIGFEDGAKYMAERMYSEEEVMNALHSVELKYNRDFSKIYEGVKEWFEQFKKK